MLRIRNQREVDAAQFGVTRLTEKSVTQSEILGLILKAKNGNYAMLRKLVSAVKIGMKDKSIDQFSLLENGEFLAVTAKCFTTNDHALQLDALSILVWIAENGRSNEAELMIKSAVIPTLVASLNCQKKNVRDQSLNFLRIISECDASVEVFSKAEILSTLKKMARQTTNLDSLANIGKILCNFFRNGYLEKAGDGGSTLLSMKETLHEVMPVLRILAQTADKRIMETVTSFVKLTSKLDEAVEEEIRSSGIHKLISDGERQQVKADPVNMTVPTIPKVEIDTQLDGSQVLAAVSAIATGNAKSRSDKKLQRVTSSMMKCLKEDEAFITEIFGCDGLLDFLLTCLKPNRNYTVQLAGVHIISLILSDGTDDLSKSLLASGLVPAIAALLPRGHGQLCDKVLSTLRTFCEAGDADWTWKVTEHLQATNNILPSLITLAEKKTKEKASLSDIAWIFGTFCIGHHRPSLAAENLNRVTNNLHPPLQAVRDITALAKILLKTGDDEITGQVMTSLTIVVSVEGCHRIIFESGIMPSVLRYILSDLHHSLKFAASRFLIVAAVDGSVATSNVRIYEFFKSVNINQGMREFHKIFFCMDGRNEANDEVTAAGLAKFFQRVAMAIFPEPSTDVVISLGKMECKIGDVVLESGFTHTLIKCLGMESVIPVRCREFAKYMLLCFSNIASEKWATFLVEAGTIPALLKLLESADSNSEWFITVVSSLAHLTAKSTVARDQIIDSGGLPRLFALIRMSTHNVKKLRHLIEYLYTIMQRSPKTPVKHFEPLPMYLRQILTENNLRKFRRDSQAYTEILMEIACDCMQEFADYGLEQVEQLERVGLLRDIFNALKFNEDATRESAVLAVSTICLKKPDTRVAFLELGILEYLPRLLQSPLRDARRGAVFLMTEVFHNDVTPAQKKAARETYIKHHKDFC